MRRRAVVMAVIAGTALTGAAVFAMTGPWRDSGDALLPNLPDGEVSAEDIEPIECDSCAARHQRLKKNRDKDKVE